MAKSKTIRPISFIEVYSMEDYEWLLANMVNCEIWKVDVIVPRPDDDGWRKPIHIVVTTDDVTNEAFTKIRTSNIKEYEIKLGTSESDGEEE